MLIHTDSCPKIADLCLMEVGGEPQVYIEVSSEQEIKKAYQYGKQHQLPIYILGGGSNIVCSDHTLQVLVIKPVNQECAWKPHADGWIVRAGAGVVWEEIVAQAVSREAWGIECLAGIPGCAGAAPIQNIGAYGQSLSDCCTAVRVFDAETLSFKTFSAQECEWGYRDSIFKQKPQRYCVVWIELVLRNIPSTIRYAQLQQVLDAQDHDRHEYSPIQRLYDTVRQIRATKSMLWDEQDPNHRSVGSFFLNPVVSQTVWKTVQEQAEILQKKPVPHWPQTKGIKLAAAWLIEHSDCPKGYTHPKFSQVALSSNHTLAIINQGGACAQDIIEFAQHIQSRVYQTFGVLLKPEVNLWGFESQQLSL